MKAKYRTIATLELELMLHTAFLKKKSATFENTATKIPPV